MTEETHLATTIPNNEYAVIQEVDRLKSSDKMLTLIRQAAEYQHLTKRVSIKTDEDEKLAVESVAAISTTIKEAEAMRQSVVAFPKKFTSMVDGMFKGLTDDLKSYKSTLSDYLTAYQNKKRVEQQKAQDRIQKAMNESIAKMEKAGIDVSSVPVVAPRFVEPAKVRTENATAYTKTRWVFEVTDKRALVMAVAAGVEKLEALDVNEQYIRGLVSAGVRDVPGVRIYQEQSTQIRARN